MAVHPLIQPTVAPSDPSGDEFIPYPDNKSPAELSYGQTIDVDPDHAAKVLGLSKQLGENPQLIDNNLADAEKAAAAPTSDYWQNLAKQYPTTHDILIPPQNMAVAKDDIENMTKNESLVRSFSSVDRLWRTANAAGAGVGSFIAKAPAAVYDIAAIPQNLLMKAIGHPEQEVRSPDWLQNNPVAKFYDQQVAAWQPPPMADYGDLVEKGDFAGIGQKLAENFVEFAPVLATSLLSAGAGTTLMVGQSVTGALARNRTNQIDPGMSGLDAFYHGAFTYALMDLSVLPLLKGWGANLTKEVGVDSAKKIVVNFFSALGYHGVKFGSAMTAMGSATDWADVVTGADPHALDNFAKKAKERFIGGFGMGALLSVYPGGREAWQRNTDLRRVQQTQDAYLKIGENLQAQKTYTRARDLSEEHLGQLVNGTPLQTIGIAADKFKILFQDAAMDPSVEAKKLGVDDQLIAAGNSTVDITIPMTKWAHEYAKSPIYDKAKDDIRFDSGNVDSPNVTVNEARERQQVTDQDAVNQANQAAKEDPSISEGLKFIHDDILQKQIAMPDAFAAVPEADRPKLMEANATIFAAKTVNEARRMTMDPKEYYQKGRPTEMTTQPPGQAEGVTFQPGLATLPSLRESMLSARRLAHVTAEAIPSVAFNHEINSASPEVRQEFTRKVAADVFQGIADLYGVKAKVVEGSGGYEKVINANVITDVPVTKKGGKTDFSVPDMLAGAEQYIAKQDAVPFFMADPKASVVSKDVSLGRAIRFSSIPTPDKVQLFRDLLQSSLGPSAGFTQEGPDIFVINFRDKATGVPYMMDDGAFKTALARMEEQHGQNLGIIESSEFGSKGDYGPVQDWGANPDGKSVLQRANPKGSPDIQSGLDNRRALYEKLLAQYSGDALRQRETQLANDRTARAQGIEPPSRQVETPEFKNYFGQSVITIDGEPGGTPMVVYHGTRKGFNTFKMNPNDIGIHVGTSTQAADRILFPTYDFFSNEFDSGRHIKPLYAKIEHPLVMPDLGQWTLDRIKSELRDKAVMDSPDEVDIQREHNVIDRINTMDQARKYLKSKGYDGIIYLNQGESLGGTALYNREFNAGAAFRAKFGVNPDEVSSSSNAKNRELAKSPEWKAWYKAMDERQNAISAIKDYSYIVLDPKQLKSATGNIGKFDPKKGDIRLQGDPDDPRAFLASTPEKDVIGLLKADPSSFVHEMAHQWLNGFNEFMGSGNPTARHMDDWKIISDWLKIDEGKVITKEQHEKFARGFEAYLREGVAPHEGLRSAFRRFSQWLNQLYKLNLKYFAGVELNPGVRGMFDRMLASEDEIAFAHEQIGMNLGVDIPGLDPRVRNRLETLHRDARDLAIEELTQKQMAEFTTADQTKRMNESVKARLAAEDAVRKDPVRLAMAAVKETLKGDPLKTAQEYWLNKMSKADRAAFDQLAEARGFSCGDELAHKIIDLRPEAEEIQGRVDSHMAAFPALKDTPEIKAEAARIVHNERSTELLAQEAAIFQDLVQEASGDVAFQRLNAAKASIDAKAARAKAQEMVAARPFATVGQFMPYYTAERNAALRVAKALQANDFAEAAKYKRIQMLNHALASEALKAREESGVIMRFFDRFASRDQDLKNLPYGFVRQIDQLLSSRGLAAERPEDAKTYLEIAKQMLIEKDDPSEIAHRTGYMLDGKGQWQQESLQDVMARIENDYRNIAMPDAILKMTPKPYQTMTLGEMRDLRAAIKAISAVGHSYENFLDETRRTDIKTESAAAREWVETKIGMRHADVRDVGTRHGANAFNESLDAIRKLPDSIAPSLVNLLSFCDFLDAGDPNGPFKRNVYRPLKRGGDGVKVMDRKAVEEMKALHEQFWKPGEYADLRTDKVWIKSRDRDMTKDEVLAYAMNQGNEINKQRLRDGFHFTAEQDAEILSHVDQKMWDYVQAIWNYNDTYWPSIVRQQEKVAGETPEKVTPSPVETPFGTKEGGYFPLSYDYRKSAEAADNIDKRNALYKTQGAVYAHTEHGFTHSRVNTYENPVRLDTKVEFNHLRDVIHDLNLRQPVIDVSRFLRQKDVREAVANAIGIDGLRAIEKHVKWVASDQGTDLTFGDSIVRKLRMGGTVAILGLRPLQAPLSLTGNVINGFEDLGFTGFTQSMWDYSRDRTANNAFIDQHSPRMANRQVYRDRDLSDMASGQMGEASAFQHYTFYFDSQADMMVSRPIWLTAYKANVNKYGEKTAVDIADEAVTKAMGSGDTVDQAHVQRGSEMQKVFSWWYSWSSMMFNRAWRQGKFAGLEYDKGNYGTAVKIMGSAALYGFVLQGAAETFWRELFRNSKRTDEKKRKMRVIQRMIGQPISYVPFVRDVAQFMMEESMGQPSHIGLPFAGVLESAGAPAIDILRGFYTGRFKKQKFFEDSARVLALKQGYPQIFNTWVFNFIDFLNDEGDLTMRDILSRRTKT